MVEFCAVDDVDEEMEVIVKVETCDTWMVRVRVAVEVEVAIVVSCAKARRGRRKANRMLMKCIVIDFVGPKCRL